MLPKTKIDIYTKYYFCPKIPVFDIEIQNENVDTQEQSKETENQNEHSEQMSNKTESSIDPDTKEYLSQRWNENFQNISIKM